MNYHVGVEQPRCVFCQIISGSIAASVVFEDADSIAFLDSHPLFLGHVLLCPRDHYATMSDLPPGLIGPLFTNAQLLCKAVETALHGDGTFVAINNRISQTVPHLHVHVVPRRHKDGLRGFFWPRQKYQDDDARRVVTEAIRREVQNLTIGRS